MKLKLIVVGLLLSCVIGVAIVVAVGAPRNASPAPEDATQQEVTPSDSDTATPGPSGGVSETDTAPPAVSAPSETPAPAPASPSPVDAPIIVTPPLVPHVAFAGCRASDYGTSPFPNANGWSTAVKNVSSHWQGSTPVTVWLVGEILLDSRDCQLQWEDPRHEDKIVFEDAGIDHDAYLSYFDQVGIRVLLSLEPGDADVGLLIDLVMTKFRSHPSVIGIGVDTEWLGDAEFGAPVTDQQAQAWEEKVKSYGDYVLWLKHWDVSYMPPTYRGNIWFIDDSENNGDLSELVASFGAWADHFSGNMVLFQIGYPSDEDWWSGMADPVGTIGNAVADRVTQHCGIIWVDFSLDVVLRE